MEHSQPRVIQVDTDIDDYEIPDSLDDAPPSAKLVFVVLRNADETLAQHEIADRTKLDARQVRTALVILDEHGLVSERPNMTDLREKYYSLETPEA